MCRALVRRKEERKNYRRGDEFTSCLTLTRDKMVAKKGKDQRKEEGRKRKSTASKIFLAPTAALWMSEREKEKKKRREGKKRE